MNLKSINEQVVTIIGASSGIGRDAALRFSKKGAKVVVSARGQEGLSTLVEQIQQQGGEAIAVPCDVADFDQVKTVMDKTVDRFGRIDTMVNAAAVSVFGMFDQVTPEEFKRVVDVTMMGQVYSAMAAVPYLKQQGRGSLVHITSMEARRSLPYQSAYSAAKHGATGFLDAMRLELKHEGYQINVANILPGVINTPFYTHNKTKLGVKPTGIPPYYTPDLVTDAILYAAENPVRDYIVSDVGRLLDVVQRISPGLVDAVLLAIAFEMQKTQDVRSENDPNNLYEPVNEFDRVKGEFGSLEVPSLLDHLDKNPLFNLGATVFSALSALVAPNHDHRSTQQ